MCALYPSIFPPLIPILICSRNIALSPNAYFPNVLYDLRFWSTYLSHWHSQAHEAWYSLWYVDDDFVILPFLNNTPPFPLGD